MKTKKPKNKKPKKTPKIKPKDHLNSLSIQIVFETAILKVEKHISTLITAIYTAYSKTFFFFCPPLLHHNCYPGCKYSYYSNIFSVRPM